eukprot:293619-Rhodomonas_salina.2
MARVPRLRSREHWQPSSLRGRWAPLQRGPATQGERSAIEDTEAGATTGLRDDLDEELERTLRELEVDESPQTPAQGS